MEATNFSGLTACYVNCTLKKSPRTSNTNGLMEVSAKIMEAEGVKVDKIRFVDHPVAFGMQPDMTKEGENIDEWPTLFNRINKADILVIGTPIWLGEPSSVAMLFIERLYAMSSKTNEKGQYIYYGKTAGCLVTGNEDGVKNCAKTLLFDLQHIGFSIPPQADAGWIGDYGSGPSYLDKEANAQENSSTNQNTTFLTYNLMHLAKMLKQNNGYPGYGNSSKAWEEGERWKFKKPKIK